MTTPKTLLMWCATASNTPVHRYTSIFSNVSASSYLTDFLHKTHFFEFDPRPLYSGYIFLGSIDSISHHFTFRLPFGPLTVSFL